MSSHESPDYSREDDFQISQEMRQIPTFENELVGSILGIPETYSRYPTALAFSDAFTQRILDKEYYRQDSEPVEGNGEIKKHANLPYVIAVGGEGAMGKSNFLNQILMQTANSLSGEQLIELPDDLRMSTGRPVDLAYFEWIDVIRTAQKYGYGGIDGRGDRKALGDWQAEDFAAFDNLMEKAYRLFKEGIFDDKFPSEKPVKILGFSGPFHTGMVARKETDELIGFDRGISFLNHLMEDLRTRANTFLAFLLTDADSLKRRQSRRNRLPRLQGRLQELKDWTKLSHMEVVGSQREEYFFELPDSGATTYAAAVMRRQQNELLLDLKDSGEMQFAREDAHMLEKEIDLLNQGVVIFDPRIYGNQESRNNVMVKYYETLGLRLNVPPDRIFIGFNPDLPQPVHTYASLRKNNLLKKIEALDPGLLKPDITP